MKINLLLLFAFCLGAIQLSVSQEVTRTTGSEKWEGEFPSVQSLAPIYTPPVSSVRTGAEWEEIQALTITWTSYQSVLKEIVRNAQTECKVIIVCADSNTVKTYLTNNTVPLVNLGFLQVPYNSVWIRDYGQNWGYTNDVDSLILMDWKYNRPTRPLDDAVPNYIATYFNIPVYAMTQSPHLLVHTGGNFMSDGFGTGFSSNLVVQENSSLTLSQIDQIMDDFMGISRYIKMTVLPYDGIHHIDMHMKLLDEETLLVGQYPSNIADGPQIEANLQYVLSNFNSVFGTPYKVIRMPMPPEQNGTWPHQGGDYLTYTNAVFVNKTVLVPTYYQQYDTTALRIWRESLPGYRIVGINCNTTIPASGALHCITHSVGTSNPLLISHQPLPNTFNTTVPYLVSAKMLHRSGIAGARLYWRTDTLQPYSMVTMNTVNGTDWTGSIPAQQAGTRVFYYVEGTSVSGKMQVRPLSAPAGYWKFDVLGTTGAEEYSFNFSMHPVYPNPSRGITCIPLSSGRDLLIRVTLEDMLGKTVEVIYEGDFKAGDRNFFINTTGIPTGVYSVCVHTPDGKTAQRLLIK
ncbi:MAG: agmatine deiminase family protein [Bacteroidia bacterium]|nr:agmatine deiminase family protein [Bacteroidia bacterium]